MPKSVSYKSIGLKIALFLESDHSNYGSLFVFTDPCCSSGNQLYGSGQCTPRNSTDGAPLQVHNVQITCWPILDPFGFAAEIRITDAKLIVLKTFKLTQRFQTRTEAETYALKAAREWIDDSNSDVRKA